MSVLALLQETRALLARREAWLSNGLYRGVRTRLFSGGLGFARSCYPEEEPNCWCVSGALSHVGRRYPAHLPQAIRIVAELVPDGSPITDWNDRYGRRHDEVLKLLDEAVWRATPSAQVPLFPGNQ